VEEVKEVVKEIIESIGGGVYERSRAMSRNEVR
jgi:hypothetical protein